MLRYVELKTGYGDENGPAWIAHVTLSRSLKTAYFNGRALGRGGRGNHCDLVTGELFWVSGVKKKGNDRHWAGSGKVMIEETAIAEYLALTGAAELDKSRFIVIPPLPETDIEKLTELHNTCLWDRGTAAALEE